MKSSMRKAFRLPMTSAFLSYTRGKDGKVVAHSLDFDLVAVDDDEEKAFKRLRLAVKTYIEYGLSNNWTEDIVFPAPREYWENFMKAKSIRSMEPLEIEDDRMIVIHATMMPGDEHRQVACPA
jgi:hypothetical protein